MSYFSKLLPVLAACGLTVAAAGHARADFVITTNLDSLPAGGNFEAMDLSAQSGTKAFSATDGSYAVSYYNVPLVDGVVSGSLSGQYAAPATATGAYTGKYFSTGTGDIIMHFATPQTAIALLWGSVDAGNQIIFGSSAGQSIGSVYGSQITSMANGGQGYGGSFYTDITSSMPFSYLVLASNVVSFEAAEFESSPEGTAVSEPASVGLLGFGLLSLMLLRRWSKEARTGA